MDWLNFLDENTKQRLEECKNFKYDIPKLVNAKWKEMQLNKKDEKGFKKEDALIFVLELLDCNNQFFDLTKEEYNEFSS